MRHATGHLGRLALGACLSMGACVGPKAPPTPTPTPTPTPVAEAAGADAGQANIAELGACVLDSGARIEPCRVGYRTYGSLDATRSNVVLFPTWFTGTTKALTHIVPDKLVDTKRFFLILVDALGNGVSSSPSSSTRQPRLAFPRF